MQHSQKPLIEYSQVAFFPFFFPKVSTRMSKNLMVPTSVYLLKCVVWFG